MLIRKICWAVTAFAAFFAFIDFAQIGRAESAPQQAAIAAMAVATAVIPYVFTRAVEGLTEKAPDGSEKKAAAADDGSAFTA